MYIFIKTVFQIAATGGGSSSGSPSHFLPPGHSPTPSSTPVSELSPGNYHLIGSDLFYAL